jgi:hypothetical protein
MKFRVLGSLAFVAAAALAACGGGGSGSSGGGSGVIPTSQPTVAATPTPTPTPVTVAGTVVEYASSAALGGFTVTIGSIPNSSTCLLSESNTVNACGVPASPTYTAVTTATGAFSVTIPTAGTYMLTIGSGPTYATLHRSISVTSSGLSLGTLKVAALSTDEQAWLADINTQRTTVSYPVSFSNLSVDEYAEEQARAEVAAIVSGAAVYGDATEGVYGANYVASPGALNTSVLGAADLVGSASGYLTADAQWMAEKANCPNGNWQTCNYAENTGHYMNLSSTSDVWIGLGESSASFSDPPYGNEWAYVVILPGNNAGNAPASKSRFAAALPPTK